MKNGSSKHILKNLSSSGNECQALKDELTEQDKLIDQMSSMVGNLKAAHCCLPLL